eukprot:TRINITY_DN8396_c0_g1_i1.p1 TRINITY_DN8396_c0_g1~~TRINITY_DN8396_c0_g1_i1.p1  ORF type:complete len:349 (+),score=100.02 TRINITY_DN8396_c0_g1_i1:48-1094(+)
MSTGDSKRPVENGKDSAAKKQKTAPALLDSIGQNLTKTQTELKKTRTQEKFDPVQHAVQFLFSSTRSINLPPQTQFEVELRFGLTPGGFRPGILKHHFDFLCTYLSKELRVTANYSEVTDYFYEPTDEPKSKYRISFDEKDKRVLRKQRKFKQQGWNRDLACADLPYDARWAIATETDLPKPETLPDGYVRRREKTRWSFPVCNEKKVELWRVDLTMVRTFEQRLTGDSEVPIYELEFELSETGVQICQQLPQEKVSDFITQFWEFVMKTMRKLTESNDSAFFADIKWRHVAYDDLQDLREGVINHVPDAKPGWTQFPGSMPINFSRRHLSHVQKNRYWISEKTDGIR